MTGLVKFVWLHLKSLVSNRSCSYNVAAMKILALLTLAFLGVTVSAPAAEKLQHVVSFKFKSTATPDDIKKVEGAFRDLKTKIPQIVGFEWGTNVSKENHDKGFTHCFVLSFKTEKDRDDYIAHPEHKAFGKLLHPFLEDVFVIDFWAKE
jgi:Stress responsive A/B Barrel Domain